MSIKITVPSDVTPTMAIACAIVHSPECEVNFFYSHDEIFKAEAKGEQLQAAFDIICDIKRTREILKIAKDIDAVSKEVKSHAAIK